MSRDGADFYPCGICGKPVEGATYHKGCIAAEEKVELPAVPPGFKSKVRHYSVLKQCKKCRVEKYINRETDLCLACEGMP